MRRTLVVGMLLLALARPNMAAEEGGDAAGAAAGAVAIAEVRNYDNEDALLILTTAELQKLQGDIEKEGKLFAKALSAAEDAWKENPANKRRPFPRSTICRRKVDVVGTFAERARAEQKCAQLQQAKTEKAARQAALQPHNSGSQRNWQGEQSVMVSKGLPTNTAEAKAAAREALGLFQLKLAELMNPAPATR